jgi:ABC-2 type transport system ATP-binding protein
MDTHAVVATRLVKRYGALAALDGITLDIRSGEVFGLIGPNGAGKTTLIRAVVGALRPTEGDVEVLGLDPLTNRWELRSRIGYMPQQPALYPDLSTYRNVAFFAGAHRRSRNADDVDRALDLVGLADRRDDPIRTLSGGMRQRASLACALVHQPELLILDEPTAGVDPELRISFWDRFRAMAAEGTTVVVSTHQMAEALMCDRVALLRSGRVVAAEDPAVLLRSGKATVRIWGEGGERVLTMDDYTKELPAVLRDGVKRVEVQLEPLDDIVLDLIRRREEP